MELLFIFTSLVVAVCVGLAAKSRNSIELVSVAASISMLVASIFIALKVASAGVYAPFPLFAVDALGAIVMLVISCVGLAVVVYSIAYIRTEFAKNIIGFAEVKQYFILLNLFLTTMFLAITANNPILAWISIEATTLSTAFLISFYNKPSSVEAAWKYLIINSTGLLLGFFGTLLYFTAVGSHDGNGFVSWQSLMTNTAHLDPLIAQVAFVFVLIGYGTKVGLAPMHTWLPDAHSKAHAPISALLSGVLLNIAFVIVLRFKVITDIAVGEYFTQNLLMIVGVFSIFIAALIIFTQKDYKRLLAYSSIENMGIMALGFGFGGLGVFGAILHIIYNALIKAALFLSAGTIFLKYGSTKISDIRGLLTAIPITGVLFLTGFFAIVGTPPLGIFFSKMFIISEGIKTHPWFGMTALLLISILFIGFFKHASSMFFGEKPEGVECDEGSVWLTIPPALLLGIVVILSFYIPPFLSILIGDAVSHY